MKGFFRKALTGMLALAAGCALAPEETLKLGESHRLVSPGVIADVRLASMDPGYRLDLVLEVPGWAYMLLEPLEARIRFSDGTAEDPYERPPEILDWSGGACRADSSAHFRFRRPPGGARPVRLEMEIDGRYRSLRVDE